MELNRLQEHVELSWHELQSLSKTEAHFNFGVPQLLASELTLIEAKIEAAKMSRDPRQLESALSDTQTLLKRLRSLLNYAQHHSPLDSYVGN